MNANAILAVGLRPSAEAIVSTMLGQHSSVVAIDIRAAREALRGGKPAVAVVGLGSRPSPDAFDLVRELSTAGARVVVVGEGKDSELILHAMRAGAREYLTEAEEGRLESVVQSLLEATGVLRVGSVTSLFPAKGGMGATAIATNLAGALQRLGRRTCLVDLDLEMGDALSFLDIHASYSISDVVANMRRLDRDLLDASVPRHRSGIWVLSQSEKMEEVDRIDAAAVTSLLRFLRQHYDDVIVDGLDTFGDLPLAALDLSDRILLVVTQEVPAVRSAQRCAEILRKLGLEGPRVSLVVNRYQRSSPITREVIEETVGLKVGSFVSNDFQSLTRAINQGLLLWNDAPRTAVARDIAAMATAMAANGTAGAQRPTASFLKRLFVPKGAHGTH
jgi:pilus assembly protein CpaE